MLPVNRHFQVKALCIGSTRASEIDRVWSGVVNIESNSSPRSGLPGLSAMPIRCTAGWRMTLHAIFEFVSSLMGEQLERVLLRQ